MLNFAMIIYFSIKSAHIYIVITVLGCLFFLPFLGYVHLFDWDEINFAETAREMMVTGDYLKIQIDYKPFFEKPPLFIWFQVISMKWFGINEFSARFPNVVCGLVTLWVLFALGKKMLYKNFGLLWALVYFGSLLPHLYFKSGIIDPWFNLFIFLSLYFFYSATKDEENDKVKNSRLVLSSFLLSGVFAGLSLLVKGPVGILIIGLTLFIFSIIKRHTLKLKLINLIIFFLGACFISSLWYISELYFHGPEFIKEFIKYQFRLFSSEDSGHGGPFYYHFIVLLIGCFPASAFIFPGWKYDRFYSKEFINYSVLLKILLAVVLILFSVVKTKIVHYSSLAYFPITFIAAYTIFSIYKELTILPKTNKIIFLLAGLILLCIFSIIPVLILYPEMIIDRIKDPFAVACMKEQTPLNNFIFIPSVIYFFLFSAGIGLLFLRNKLYFLISIWFIMPITLLFFQVFNLPAVEHKLQGPVISFYQNIGKKERCAEPMGYKSYAHLFYTKKSGAHCLPEYVVCKTIHTDEVKKNTALKYLFTKGGFSFFKGIKIKVPRTKN